MIFSKNYHYGKTSENYDSDFKNILKRPSFVYNFYPILYRELTVWKDTSSDGTTIGSHRKIFYSYIRLEKIMLAVTKNCGHQEYLFKFNK